MALKLGKAFVQFVTVPVSFHVGLAEAEGAFGQGIAVGASIVDLDVPWAIAIKADACRLNQFDQYPGRLGVLTVIRIFKYRF
jgi:hypothetical protein